MKKIHITKMKIFMQIFLSLLILIIIICSFNSKSNAISVPLNGYCIIDNEAPMSISESIVSDHSAKEVVYYLNIEKNLGQKTKVKSIINHIGINIYQGDKQVYSCELTNGKKWIEIVFNESIKHGILEVRLYAQETLPIGFFSDFIENMRIGEFRLGNTVPTTEDMMYFIISFMGVIFSVLIGIVSLSLIKKQLPMAQSINLYGKLILISSFYILFNRNTYLISLLVEDTYLKTIIIELLGVLITISFFRILSRYAKKTETITNIKFFCHSQGVIVICCIMFCGINKITGNILQMIIGVNYLLLVYFLFLVVNEQEYLKQKIYLIVVFLTPTLSLLIQTIGIIYQIRVLTNMYNIGLFITCLFLFVPLLDLINNNLNIENQLKNKENELLQTQVLIMLSQIQPHFLYNTLDSIRYLCKKDPLLASNTILRFSQFLRRNLDSLKQKELVSFEKELEHLQNYLAIEKLRFNERLNIIYNIETSDFKLPSLTVQPLVENCVKYGVTKKREGGTIIIETKEMPHCYKITISDDGVGFDPKQKQDDGRTHIGLDNVCFRLQQQCDGYLLIESKKGIGTRFTIILPKEQNECSSN